MQKTRKTLAAVIVAVCFSPLALMAETHSHGTDYAKPSTSPARKLETDETLRTGMANVAAAVGAKIELVRASRLTAADYSILAKNVRTELADIVAQCRLPAESDRVFHEILHDMNRSLDLMDSPRLELRRAGALALVQAVKNYGRYFDQPVWPSTP